jgi:mono/diheme cytochrome c family protein
MDLTVYAQRQQRLAPVSSFTLPPAEEGRPVFDARCGNCHQGKLAIDGRLKNATWMEIGAGLWNHAPQMTSAAATSELEMRRLLAYVWDLQYTGQAGAKGNSVEGAKVFRDKRCINCHKDGATGASRSPRPGAFSSLSMVALSWGRGRQMHSQLAAKGQAWPELSPDDMANLVAFLNTLR